MQKQRFPLRNKIHTNIFKHTQIIGIIHIVHIVSYSTHDFIIHLLLKSLSNIDTFADFRLLFKDEVRALGGTSQQGFS